LTHNKINRPGEKAYAELQDFYFFDENESDIDSLLNITDAVIYSGLNSIHRLTSTDIDFLNKAFEKRKLIVGEYLLNQQEDIQVRKGLEALVSAEFTGWQGKFFSSLDSSMGYVPNWLIELYQYRYEAPYSFSSQPGMILVKDTSDIIVLQLGEELEQELPVINTPNHSYEGFDVPEFIRYIGWFEINREVNEEDVFAFFNINTTEKGDSLFEYHNLPTEFPAVIGDSQEGLRFYLCGDFSCNEVPLYSSYFMGIQYLGRLFYNNRDFSNNRKFFWEYYSNLMSGLMLNYEPPSDTLEPRPLPERAVFYSPADTASAGGDLDEEVSRVLEGSSNEVESSTNDKPDMASPTPATKTAKNTRAYRGNIPTGISGRRPYDPGSQSKLNFIFNVDLSLLRDTGDNTPASKNNINTDDGAKKWRVIISSLQSQERAVNYADSFANAEVSVHHISSLNTYRVAYSSHSSLRDAQLSFQSIANRHPDAWIVYF